MAEYTKIGRIRPDYADTWDASRSYTALEMVKSADSYHAYIAKQDVPAGTPLSNAEYWGEVLDVSDVIAESVAATNRANTAAEQADAAREAIQDDLNGMRDELHAKGDAIVCTAEGETITLTDASDDPMRGLRIFGKTEQTVTTGKNLLPYPYEFAVHSDGITFVDNGDGTITASGTASTESECVLNWDVNFLQVGETYTVTDTHILFGGVRWVLAGETFTVTSQDLAAEKSARIRVEQGTTLTNRVYRPQLERGSVATSYEPYTGGAPSPSLDWQQPLVNKGEKGSIKVTACGKNLMPNNYNRTLNGVTLTQNSDGTRTLNGTATADSPFNIDINMLPPLIPGKTYKLIMDSADGCSFYAYIILNGASTRINSGQTFVATDDAKWQFVCIFVAAGTTVLNVVCNPMIIYYGMGETFEPYATQNLAALTPNGLPGNPLGATIPDVIKAKPALMAGVRWDEKEQQYYISDSVDFERGVYVHRTLKLVFDGDEAWNYLSAYHCVTVSLNKFGVIFTPVLNNIGVYCAMANNSGTDLQVGDSEHPIENIGITSTEGWKALLSGLYASGNPFTVVYILATPTETPLSAEEIAAYRALHTNKPNTTIFNDAGAHMEVKYNADTKTYIDNKFAELSAALVNSTNA